MKWILPFQEFDIQTKGKIFLKNIIIDNLLGLPMEIIGKEKELKVLFLDEGIIARIKYH